MSLNRGVLIHLHIAAVLLGGTALFSKIIPFSAWDIIAYRAFFCALAIALFCFITKQSLKIKKHLILITFLGSFLFSVHWVTYFQAMQLSTVAIGMIAMFTFPVLTVFIEPIFHKTTIQLKDIFMGLLVIFGVILMVPELSLENNISLGVFYGLLSAIAVAFRNIIVSHYLKTVSAYAIMFNHSFVAALVLIPFSQVSPLQLDNENLIFLIILGVLFTAIPHTQKTFALRKLKAKSVSMVISLQVVYGSAFAYLLLNEHLEISTLFGGICILFAGFYESYHTLKNKS